MIKLINYNSLKKQGTYLTMPQKLTNTKRFMWKRLRDKILKSVSPTVNQSSLQVVKKTSTLSNKGKLVNTGIKSIPANTGNMTKIHKVIDYFLPLNITRYLEINHFFFPILVPDSKDISGLLDIPQEWYIQHKEGPEELNPEAKKAILIVYYKILYNLGYHNIRSDKHLVKVSEKFVRSCYFIFQELKIPGISARYMSMLQHVLVTLFLNKKIPLDLLRQLTDNKADFNFYKTGNILLLVETLVLKNTFKFLLDKISFTAIDHTYSFEKIDIFKRNDSMELTGQQNSDWHGSIGYISKDSIEMDTFYNDVKMYPSNAFSGRINLQPGLASNKKLFREYITRYQTSFNKLMIDLINNKIVLPTNHPIYGLNKNIQREVNNILPQISDMQADKRHHNFLKSKDKKAAFVLLERFNAILIEGLLNPKVRSLTNISISNDVEMDNEFSFFYYQNLERNFSSIDYLNKFDYKILFSSNFYRLDHRKQLKMLLEIFPPEVKLRILESLKYIDHAN